MPCEETHINPTMLRARRRSFLRRVVFFTIFGLCGTMIPALFAAPSLDAANAAGLQTPIQISTR